MQYLVCESLAAVCQQDASLRYAVAFHVRVALCQLRAGTGMLYPRCGSDSKLEEILYDFDVSL